MCFRFHCVKSIVAIVFSSQSACCVKACFVCLEPLIQNAFLTTIVDHKGKEGEIKRYIMQTTLRLLFLNTKDTNVSLLIHWVLQHGIKMI